MRITDKEIQHLADLSALQISQEEMKEFGEKFEGIKGFIDQIQNATVDATFEFDKKIKLENLREDKAKPSLDNEAVLKNAPDKKSGAFRVPKVVG